MADPNSTKCFSGVLRRLLCGSGGLPTHPSDQFSVDSKTSNKQVGDHHLRQEKSDEPKLKLAESTPGLVARLMGLDSLPADIKPKDNTLASYFRSKSVNSIDFLAQLDHLSPSPARHRRVRTALSFNEVPSLNLENRKHDFNIVLHFEEEEIRCKDIAPKYQELKKPEVRQRKVNNNYVKLKQYEVVKKSCKKLEDKPKGSVQVKKNIVRKTNVELKERRPAKSLYSKKKKNPRNSSSSVLNDIKDYQMHQDQPTATPKVSSSPVEHDREEKVKEESMKMLERICNLTEDDLKECYWVPSHQLLKFEDLEEICVHYGQQILELLMNQVVDELVLIH